MKKISMNVRLELEALAMVLIGSTCLATLVFLLSELRNIR
jgi:hypothetical protein